MAKQTEPKAQGKASAKNKKKTAGENKFVAFFRKIGKGFKGLISELKKVTWPSFKKVMAQTGVVLVVVLFFLVVIAAFDAGLTQLLKLLLPESSIGD